jgi:4,5-dihydroxyphthalate decarboxylase
MAWLPITLAAGKYDRTLALRDGTVQPEGIQLNYLALAVEETFWRMTRYLEFDASEMSGSAYLVERSKPDPRYIAIPVFLSRTFRHNCIYIRPESGIQKPEDLAGRRVGIPEYGLTALTWVRAFLQYDYGVHPNQIKWVMGGEEQPGREERAPVKLPDDISIELLTGEATLNSSILAGEIDAIIAPRRPHAFLEGKLRRLFPDFRAVEEDYYQRTRLFPIMHFVVIRNDVYRANKWVAESLYKAFVRAKDIALQEMADPNALNTSLPWIVPEVEREQAIFGPDLWPYGVPDNRHALEAMVQYHVEQGLIPRVIPVEELFAESTLVEFKV